MLPWDFCPSLFNYRRYFDAVTQSLGTSSPRIETLIAVILASLNHYRSRYAAEIVGERTDIQVRGRGRAARSGLRGVCVSGPADCWSLEESVGTTWKPPRICNGWHHARRDNSRCSTSPGVCRKGSRTAGMANSRLVQSGCGSRHTIVNNSWNRSHAGRARSAIGARSIGLPS